MKRILSLMLAFLMALSLAAAATGSINAAGRGAQAAEATQDEPASVELRGISIYDLSGPYTGNWVSFDSADPSAVTPLMQMLQPYGQTFAAAFAGGMVYGYMFASMGNDTRMYVLDPETNQLVFPGGSCPDGVFSMAYDHSSDRMYALCGRTEVDEPRYLGIVDLASGNVSRVAEFTGASSHIMTIAIDGNGNCYALTSDQTDSLLMRVDLDTAVCTPIGRTGVGLRYSQDMVWDHNTNRLFWAQYTASYDNGLYTIDPETGSATLIGPIGTHGHELCCLYSVDELPMGPIAGEELNVRFIDGVNGSVIEERLVPPGTVLDEATFPAVPEHEGREYQGWDYNCMPIHTDTDITAKFRDPNALIWDFETEPLSQGFEFVDRDGDELSWRWSCGESYINLYEGMGCAASFSFGEGAGEFGTDNWLITPEFTGTSIKFWMNGQDYDGYTEPLGVYVSTDGGETWSEELAYFIAPRDPAEKTVYLTEYAGRSIRVGFRHYTDLRLFRLNLDYISAEGVSDSGLLGDADLNGSISIADAILILRHAMGLGTLEGLPLALADVDGGGSVNTADAILVLRSAMGLA
ncbi:MAG: choice-of-anchor J domain-containing protein [Clostridia bacterium]|nr:choice-of-anchor J domain-containing protein [Clostridia bacterium]